MRGRPFCAYNPGLTRTTLFVALLLAAAGPLHAAAPPLPFTQESNTEEYLIRFTDQDSHAFPISQAQDAADALDRSGNDVPGNPKGYHDGYVDLGFLEPYFSGDRLVDFWDCKEDDDTPCDNGQATTARIRMPTSVYSTLQNPGGSWSTEMCLRMVLGHELFHHVEFAYVDEAGGSGCGPWPDAACEGMARMMQDQIYTDIDTAASVCASAQGEFNNYLNDTNRSIWDISYTAALWWKWLAEKYGSVNFEPERGADFIREWWEDAVGDFDTPDIIQTTRDTIQLYGDCCVNGAFHDFALANLLKDFDRSNLSASQQARWSYVDEGQGFGQSNYADVEIFGNQSVKPGQSAHFTGFVSDYGVLYHGADLDECPSGRQLRVTLDLLGASQPTSGFAIVILRGDEVIDVDKKQGTGWFHSRFIPVAGYTRVVTVMNGFVSPLALDLDVECRGDWGGVDFPLMMNPKPTHGGPPPAVFTALDVDVDVIDDLGAALPQLDPDVFEVSIGPEGAALPAEVLAVIDTPIGQTLRMALPPGLGAGAHRLAVRVGDETVAADGAVLLGTRLPDQIVLLDRSQSMATLVGGRSRFDVARRAARAFAGAALDGTQLGLVAFAGNGSEPNDDAVEALDLAPLDATQRSDFAAALASLAPPSGPTSIGDGLAAAARSFEADGAIGQERHAVLLSDGAESEALAWPDVRSAVLASGMRVHAIALGANADQGLLAEIAAETQGSFQFVAESPAETLQSRLTDAFLRASERAHGRQRFVETELEIANGTTAAIPIAVGPEAAGHASFAVHWDDPAADVAVALVDARGTPVATTAAFSEIAGITTDVDVVSAATPETWELRVTALGGNPTVSIAGAGDRFDGRYFISRTGHQLDAAPVGRTGGFASALPVLVQASLLDAAGPVTGAVGEAEVEHPDGSLETLHLADDGIGADAAAADGVYTARFRRTTAWSTSGLPETVPGARGSYRVKVRFPNLPGAAGNGRFDEHAFWVGVGDAIDTDGDGLLDRYEDQHACLADSLASEDPDGDGLSSTQELAAGTDPCSSDTDEGGEHDGSEIARGGNPLDPRDDRLPAPGFFALVTRINELHVPQDPRTVPQPNANLLRVPSAPEYALLLIERRERNGATALPWTERTRVDPRTLGGVWLDAGLAPGLTFEYRMRGIDAEGNESALSPTIEAQVKTDPLAPIGSLRIPGSRRTDDPSFDVAVDLYLEDDPGAIEMQVGPASARNAFEPYAQTKSIDTQTPLEPEPLLVVATLRDAAGNESLRYAEEIVVHPRGTLGDLRARVDRANGGSDAGVLVRLAGLPGELMALSDANGDVWLPNLLPGDYTVEFVEPDGSIGAVAPGVLVSAGEETDLGTVLVPEPGALAAAFAALAALVGVRRRYAGGSR